MLIDKVKETIEKYHLLNKDDKVVVGVSGGPDSMTLLNILVDLGYNVSVCHINHGLRENALKDEQFVKSFCEGHNIPFYLFSIIT